MAEIGSFDASQHEPSEAFEALPPGWYAMQAVASEVRQAKGSESRYLWVEFETLETHHPKHKGRKAWARFNLWNTNPQAVEIAQREMSALCRAVGVMQVTNSEALHHKPLAIKLKVRQEQGYEPSNDITGYDALAARFGTMQAPAQQQQQPQTTSPGTGTAPPAQANPPSSGTPPWAR